ncbi:hypothetical protein ACIGHF_11100 [Stenotrophomonas sp. NPDC077464]|uniref:hypothetical protein n=1 Tax=unclassified Stenotrophomonas TaxID=196198 RepID=UPI0037D7404D
MASARVAHPARWTPLLLTAAAMMCLLVALLGGKASVNAGTAQTIRAAVAGSSQCGDPAPSRPEPGFHACAATEKEAEHARPGTPAAPGWRQTLLSSRGSVVATDVPLRSSIPTRPLRSHLSQAPPVRA